MAKVVRYHPSFASDVIEAAGWYDDRSSGLGQAFADLVADATARAISSPEQFAADEDGLRFVPVHRFPYVVLFDCRGDQLLLLGVFHTAMSKDRWQSRSQGSGT